MSEIDSYQADEIIEEQKSDRHPMENVAIGQKFIVYAMLTSFAGLITLMVLAGPVAITINGISSILGIIGLVRISKGMGYSILVLLVFILLVLKKRDKDKVMGFCKGCIDFFLNKK